ncbi:MAG TPA: hypothetical protein PKZ78_08395, partial [Candidatus Goldiibacteriota bacterium]|nr:hypothetical protein [Candidatus Goldiibacteriota bacterium]
TAVSTPAAEITPAAIKQQEKDNNGNHFGDKRHADGWEDYKRMKEEQAKNKDDVKGKEIDKHENAKDKETENGKDDKNSQDKLRGKYKNNK